MNIFKQLKIKILNFNKNIIYKNKINQKALKKYKINNKI